YEAPAMGCEIFGPKTPRPRVGRNALLEECSSRSQMRILIVEDEPDLLKGLTQALREEGYAVDPAEDGAEDLFKAESWDYDAIVLDIMLPKLDGWELL